MMKIGQKILWRLSPSVPARNWQRLSCSRIGVVTMSYGTKSTLVYPSQANPITTKNDLFPFLDFYLIVLVIYIIFCATSPLDNHSLLGSLITHLTLLFHSSPKSFMLLPWVSPFHCYDDKVQQIQYYWQRLKLETNPLNC